MSTERPSSPLAPSCFDYEGSTTPPVTGRPPNARMTSTNIPPLPVSGGTFDVVQTYHKLLAEDPDLTMPVCAIEALITGLASMPASTVSETLDLVQNLTEQLKRNIKNPISLSAGTDLFQQYLITSLRGSAGTGSFDDIRAHLLQNGHLVVQRAKAARETIAGYGKKFIRDGHTILTNGGSRVVGSLLNAAAESGKTSGQGSVRFKVIYVVSGSDKMDKEAQDNITALRERDIPVAVIAPMAVAYSMGEVTQCFVGAEGVVENGGIVSRMGTYQMAILAKAKHKPFHVVSESHKFVRIFPLGQKDLGFDQNVIEFLTCTRDEGVADVGGMQGGKGMLPSQSEDAVDYTPPEYISGIITENGVLSPAAVSEELIKIWF